MQQFFSLATKVLVFETEIMEGITTAGIATEITGAIAAGIATEKTGANVAGIITIRINNRYTYICIKHDNGI